MINLVRTIRLEIYVPEFYFNEKNEKISLEDKNGIIRDIVDNLRPAEKTFQMSIEPAVMSPSVCEKKFQELRNVIMDWLRGKKFEEYVQLQGNVSICSGVFPDSSIIFWPYCERFADTDNTGAAPPGKGTRIVVTRLGRHDSRLIAHEIGHMLHLGEHCEGEGEYNVRCPGCLMHYTGHDPDFKKKQVDGRSIDDICPYCKAKLGLIPMEEVYRIYGITKPTTSPSGLGLLPSKTKQVLSRVKPNIIQSKMPENKTNKCKEPGCNKPSGKNTNGYCRDHFLKSKEKELTKDSGEGVVESITSTVTGFWSKGRKEEKPTQQTVRCPKCGREVPNLTWMGMCHGCTIRARKVAEAEKPLEKKHEFERKPLISKITSPEPTPPPPQPQEPQREAQQTTSSSETGTSETKKCPYCLATIGKIAKVCPKCGTDLGAYEKEEAKKGKGLKGRIWGDFKEPFKEKGKEAWEKTKAEPGKILGESLGKAFKGLGKRWETTKSHIGSALTFAILFPTTFWFTTAFTIPQVEGLLGRPIMPNWINMAMATTTTLLVLCLIFFVVLPPSVILGQRGVNFSSLNGLLLGTLALGAGLWGTTNLFMPYWAAVDPTSYELMMCLMKYGGNMQICALGEEEIQYEKEGTYETLKLEVGIVTPDRTIYPLRPKSKQEDYDFSFTLKNENQVGSLYDITVPSIDIGASSDEEGEDMEPGTFFYGPPFTIKPGGYRVVQAEFSQLPYCERYMYFQINMTSEQLGGGSAKYGVISNEKDNENFIYFFDPEIKTNPGPLDIYLYTYPFVIGVDEAWERQTEESKPGFRVFIHIVNKEEGIAQIHNITFIQTSESDNPIIAENSIICENYYQPVNDPSSYCPNKRGNCIKMTYPEPIREEDENGENQVYIKCDGTVSNDSFIGKITDFISVNVVYNYTQIFKEQIGCIKPSELFLCTGITDEDECWEEGCYWCEECDGGAVATTSNVCVPSKGDCGYHCELGRCNAQCIDDTPCSGTRPFCWAFAPYCRCGGYLMLG